MAKRDLCCNHYSWRGLCYRIADLRHNDLSGRGMIEMIVKVMQRRSGKTTELIKYSHHTGIPIVVSNIARVSIIEHMAKRMELDIPEPLTSNTVFFRHGMAGFKDRRILIDDLDAVISELFRNAGAQPELATMGIDNTDILIQRELYDGFKSQSDQWLSRNGVDRQSDGGADDD